MRPSFAYDIHFASALLAKQILVVDDDPTIRRVITTILSEHGYRVFEVSNGLEAVRKTQTQKFDLITMDMAMGYLDGIDAISILQNETQTPIIVISAYLTDNTNSDLDARGILFRLPKPFTVDQLTAIVDRALG